VIELEDVWRTYELGGRALHALAGIDERILPGEHVAIMGPSGSGKSTLLNLIGCLDRPTRGTYRFEGRDVTNLSDSELAHLRGERVGYVFQSYHLVKRLEAWRNVELPLVLAGVERAERRERVDAALAEVGLAPRSGHRPAQLSGGERQRVAIARATVRRPSVLLADEPTGNLDRATGQQILELLARFHAQGMTLIVVTHDLAVARRAQRVLLLEDGRIARRLAPAELAGALAVLGSAP
jgi:putative ABC transport system ATP-binding protein